MTVPSVSVKRPFSRSLRGGHAFALTAFFLLAAPSVAHAGDGTPAATTAVAGSKKAADLITRGTSLFEDQEYEESIQTLSAALLQPDLATEQRVEIYRLLALDYITIGRNEEAESAVRGLLAQKPGYSLPASESPRFRDFFDTARKRWFEDGRPGLVTEAAPKQRPVVIKSQTPTEVAVGETLTIVGHIEDPDHKVATMTLRYRSRGASYTRVDVPLAGNTFRTQVPANDVKAPLVDYYLEAEGADGLPIAARGDATDPLRTVVRESKAGWVVPVAIAGGIVGAGALVGGLALAGVFKSKGNSAPNMATISINVAPAFR